MENADDLNHLPSKLSFSAPGKVILHGEHSVVYNYPALAASVNLGTTVQYSQINPTSTAEAIKLRMPDIGVNLDLSASFVESLFSLVSEKTWNFTDPHDVPFESLLENLQQLLVSQQFFSIIRLEQQKVAVKSCLFLMAAILKFSYQNTSSLKSFQLCFSSNLPVGAGAGSSASYNVCVASVFVCLASFTANTQTSFKLDEETKALISSWAFLGERIIHGNASGLDNTICTFGSLISFRRPSTIKKIHLNSAVEVLLVDTKVSRKTKLLVEQVAERKERHKGAVTAIMEALGCVSSEAEELYILLDEAKSQRETNQKEIERLFSRLEELWSMNHSLLQALGVSHPCLEKIVEVSKEHNLCGKLTGAGGGGFAIVLLPSAMGYDKLKEELKSCGFDVKDVKLGGPGVQMHIESKE